MLELTTVPVVIEDFCVRQLGENTIYISEKGDSLHSIDSMGTFIWKLIDNKRTLAAILNEICDEFEVSRDLAQNDLFAFITDLNEKKILKFES